MSESEWRGEKVEITNEIPLLSSDTWLKLRIYFWHLRDTISKNDDFITFTYINLLKREF